MICLDYRHAKLWCCEDISTIENYDKAIADKTQTWVCHHRLELHPDGSLRFTEEQLKKLGLYEHRPANELIFMPFGLHTSMHNKANKEAHSFHGELNPMYGKHHSAEARRKMSVANIGRYKDRPRSGSRWVKYGMTRNAIMKKLHLGRKQVEQLDKDNKLIEVLNGLD